MRTLAKPAGLSVFPRHGNPDADCLLSQLLLEQPWRTKLTWPPGFEGGIAHRLDIGTSGAVAVADSVEELTEIRGAFAAQRLLKTYWLWSAREVSWDAHHCAKPLAHDRRHRGRMVVKRSANTPHRGRWLDAETTFNRLDGALWQAQMRSGVTHQIPFACCICGNPHSWRPPLRRRSVREFHVLPAPCRILRRGANRTQHRCGPGT